MYVDENTISQPLLNLRGSVLLAQVRLRQSGMTIGLPKDSSRYDDLVFEITKESMMN